MELLTLDFETFYSKDYTLKKLTTEGYIRDSRFKAHGCGFKWNEEGSFWVSGKDLPAFFEANRTRIEQAAVLAHHAHFDGLILSHHYGIVPKAYFDTLSMGRVLHGHDVGGSLAKLVAHYKLRRKMSERLVATMGIEELGPDLETALAEYCLGDVDNTYDLCQIFLPQFKRTELKFIDITVKMFTRPLLTLDTALLEEAERRLAEDIDGLLREAGVDNKEVLRSDAKFAELLGAYIGPENVPTKISKTTGLPAYAFAKTDKAFTDLVDSGDPTVAALVLARLSTKTSIMVSRTARMSAMAKRGPAPVYIKYAGAVQTHRTSGGDKMNWQNLSKGSVLRKAVMAPEGYVLGVCDSSNIESRVLDTLAGQMDAVQRYRDRQDPYTHLASKIYHRVITKEDADERQLGKVAKLGLGFGMGAKKFKVTAQNWGINIDDEMAFNTVETYRNTHGKVVELWNRAGFAIEAMSKGMRVNVDSAGLVVTDVQSLILPNGLRLRYPQLRRGRDGWEFFNGKFWTKIYGGKLVENIVQALARIIVSEQTVLIARELPVVMFAHDEAVTLMPEATADAGLSYMLECMRTPPEWWPTVPIGAEAGYAVRYSDAKK